MREVCWIGPEEAADSKAAKILAKARMGPGYKVTSIQRGGSAGGWSVCFLPIAEYEEYLQERERRCEEYKRVLEGTR